MFEKEDYVESIYPAVENKKNKTLGLVLIAFEANTQTHTHTRTMKKKPC